MSNNFSLVQWSIDIVKYKYLKSEYEADVFLSLVGEAEDNILIHPLEIGGVLFSIFSSRHDHGVYEAVFSVIKLLSIHDYYYCLIQNIERLNKEDADDHWKSTLLNYAARPLEYEDYSEMAKALLHFDIYTASIFIDEMLASDSDRTRGFSSFFKKFNGSVDYE